MAGSVAHRVIPACLSLMIMVGVASGSPTYIVGGKTGWAVPASTSFYSTWAAQRIFMAGDVLLFNFETGDHTVAEVSKADYDSCRTTNLIPTKTKTTGPVSMTLTAGTHYYICTVKGHCEAGQKLRVFVS